MHESLLESTNIPVMGSASRPMATDLFCNNTQRSPVVVYIHGFNGFKDWGNFDLIARQFALQGFAFVKMNLSHNGTTMEHLESFADVEAFGQNNYSTELFDVNAILDWLCAEENPYAHLLDTTRIYLLGHSRGGGVALIKAAEDPRVKRVVTWASVSACKTPWGMMAAGKLDQWKKDGAIYYTNKRTGQKLPLYYQLYEDYCANEDRFDLQKAISGLNIPILICHGSNDPAVPVESARQLHAWQPHSTLFIVDSDHVFGRSHPWTRPHLPGAMQMVVDESIRFLQHASV